MSRTAVSTHAYCQVRERVGDGRHATDRISARVCEQGLRATEFHGKLERYMVTRETPYPGIRAEFRMIYLYGGIGGASSLITLYKLSNSLIRQACVLQKRA